MIHSCRSQADFERLRREGVRRSGAKLWIRHVTDVNCSPPRVAFALGRRNGTAPRRNRLRRQLRALLRDPSVPVAPGLYLVGHHGAIAEMAPTALRRELEAILARLGGAS